MSGQGAEGRGFDELCVEPVQLGRVPLNGFAPGIFPGSVYRCQGPDDAERLLAGGDGYVYQRDGHPNADWLADRVCALHAADWAFVTSSGMAALATASLGLLAAGDEVLVSNQLYGRTSQLLVQHWRRLGVKAHVMDPLDVQAVAAAITPATRLVVVETLSNPMLRLAPIDQLAEIVAPTDAVLLVDNTFASPYFCQPLRHGADLVMESISKMMNGHSDVMLGALAGCQCQPAESPWSSTAGSALGAEVFRDVVSVWGLASSPFDCWLALRGTTTLHLRMQRAADNALAIAEFLLRQNIVTRVVYPGLPGHPDHSVARRLFRAAATGVTGEGGSAMPAGSMLTFEVSGGRSAVAELFRAIPEIPFCPSLGEVSTTLSHPATTSHRSLSQSERTNLGIEEGTIRLSVGTESADSVIQVLGHGLAAIAS